MFLTLARNEMRSSGFEGVIVNLLPQIPQRDQEDKGSKSGKQSRNSHDDGAAENLASKRRQ